MSVTPIINMFTTADDYKVKEIWKQVKGDMSEKFKAVLLFYSEEHEDFEKAIDEWNDITHSLNGGKQDGNFCICSHDIFNNFYVKNRYNKNKLRIGSDCIEKYFGEEVYEQCRIILKRLNYKNNGSGKNRMCATCHRHSIPINTEEWKTLCKSCYKKGEVQEAPLVLLEGRKCNTCNKITIKLEEPHWIKTCTFCYKKKKEETEEEETEEEETEEEETEEEETEEEETEEEETEEERICIKCKETTLSPSAPEYYKICWKCYRKQTDYSNTERICIKCKKTALNPSAPKYHKMCWKCYKSTLNY